MVVSNRLSIRHYQKGADLGPNADLPSQSCPSPPWASLYPLPGVAGSKAALTKQLLHPDGEPGEKSAGKVRLETGTYVAAECAQLAPLQQPQLPDYKRLSPEALPFAAIIVGAVRKRK